MESKGGRKRAKERGVKGELEGEGATHAAVITTYMHICTLAHVHAHTNQQREEKIKRGEEEIGKGGTKYVHVHEEDRNMYILLSATVYVHLYMHIYTCIFVRTLQGAHHKVKIIVSGF